MLESRHLHFCHHCRILLCRNDFVPAHLEGIQKSDWFWYYAVAKWIEVIAVGESCFAVRHCCYVDSDAGEAFQQRALLLLKLPLKKRSINQLKVD